MLDKNISYILVGEDKVSVGQYPSTGAWYCKELSDKPENLEAKIDFVIDILNRKNIKKKQENNNSESVVPKKKQKKTNGC